MPVLAGSDKHLEAAAASGEAVGLAALCQPQTLCQPQASCPPRALHLPQPEPRQLACGARLQPGLGLGEKAHSFVQALHKAEHRPGSILGVQRCMGNLGHGERSA